VVYYVAGLAIGFAIEWAIGGPVFPRDKSPDFWRIPGIGLIAAGFALGVVAFLAIRRAGSNGLVVSGPYRWSRNPLYLAMALLSAGVAVYANAIWPLLMLPIVITFVQRRIIDREERDLERTFGREYRRYRDRVPRWL
jgi:protein-S-isoprenylcysteine O-methyltransferase Ste14